MFISKLDYYLLAEYIIYYLNYLRVKDLFYHLSPFLPAFGQLAPDGHRQSRGKPTAAIAVRLQYYYSIIDGLPRYYPGTT